MVNQLKSKNIGINSSTASFWKRGNVPNMRK